MSLFFLSSVIEKWYHNSSHQQKGNWQWLKSLKIINKKLFNILFFFCSLIVLLSKNKENVLDFFFFELLI